jgi:hypothetical protein
VSAAKESAAVPAEVTHGETTLVLAQHVADTALKDGRTVDVLLGAAGSFYAVVRRPGAPEVRVRVTAEALVRAALEVELRLNGPVGGAVSQ